MARTAVSERPKIFVRSNFEPYEPAATREPDEAAVRSLEAAIHGLLDLIEQAMVRIEEEQGVEAAVRQIWASLLQIKVVVGRDPGIRMAADDLYEAAAALVAGKGIEPGLVDIRRWRLLREADRRLRTRLGSGCAVAQS